MRSAAAPPSKDLVVDGSKEGTTITGGKNQLSVNINGEEFFQKVLGAALSGTLTRDCELRFTEE